MILLALGVETLARLMEPKAPRPDTAWLLVGPADEPEAEETPLPAE